MGVALRRLNDNARLTVDSTPGQGHSLRFLQPFTHQNVTYNLENSDLAWHQLACSQVVSNNAYLAQLPIGAYEPLSELQRRAVAFAHTELLDQAISKFWASSI